MTLPSPPLFFFLLTYELRRGWLTPSRFILCPNAKCRQKVGVNPVEFLSLPLKNEYLFCPFLPPGRSTPPFPLFLQGECFNPPFSFFPSTNKQRFNSLQHVGKKYSLLWCGQPFLPPPMSIQEKTPIPPFPSLPRSDEVSSEYLVSWSSVLISPGKKTPSHPKGGTIVLFPPSPHPGKRVLGDTSKMNMRACPVFSISHDDPK